MKWPQTDVEAATQKPESPLITETDKGTAALQHNVYCQHCRETVGCLQCLHRCNYSHCHCSTAALHADCRLASLHGIFAFDLFLLSYCWIKHHPSPGGARHNLIFTILTLLAADSSSICPNVVVCCLYFVVVVVVCHQVEQGRHNQ